MNKGKLVEWDMYENKKDEENKLHVWVFIIRDIIW